MDWLHLWLAVRHNALELTRVNWMKVGAMKDSDEQGAISKGRDLTERQRKFATKVLDGSSPTLVHAYRAVYDCKGDTVKQKKACSLNELKWKSPTMN